MRRPDYPWPASQIDVSLMQQLHMITVSRRPRTPITRLIQQAVHDTVRQHQPIILAFLGPDNEPQPPQEAA